jgi:hypothetical protein
MPITRHNLIALGILAMVSLGALLWTTIVTSHSAPAKAPASQVSASTEKNSDRNNTSAVASSSVVQTVWTSSDSVGVESIPDYGMLHISANSPMVQSANGAKLILAAGDDYIQPPQYQGSASTTAHQDVVVFQSPSGEQNVLYASSKFYGDKGNGVDASSLKISPTGAYAAISVTSYEWMEPHIFETLSGKNVLPKEPADPNQGGIANINLGFLTDILWAPNDAWFVLHTPLSESFGPQMYVYETKTKNLSRVAGISAAAESQLAYESSNKNPPVDRFEDFDSLHVIDGTHFSFDQSLFADTQTKIKTLNSFTYDITTGAFVSTSPQQ